MQISICHFFPLRNTEYFRRREIPCDLQARSYVILRSHSEACVTNSISIIYTKKQNNFSSFHFQFFHSTCKIMMSCLGIFQFEKYFHLLNTQICKLEYSICQIMAKHSTKQLINCCTYHRKFSVVFVQATLKCYSFYLNYLLIAFITCQIKMQIMQGFFPIVVLLTEAWPITITQ